MDRSGRSAKPVGRSWAGVGRTCVSMWRRPSLPRVDHGTRLPGPPLRVGPVHRSPSSPPNTGSSAAAPVSMPRIARSHTFVAVTATTPRAAPCATSRHSWGPPGSTSASRRPAAPASACSAYATAASPPSTPAATSTDRASGGVAERAVTSSSSGTSRRRSTTKAMVRPRGTATGSPATRPPAPSRSSSARSPTRVASRLRAAIPVVAARHPAWRVHPRAMASPGCDGRSRRSASPAGTAAASITRASVRCRLAGSPHRAAAGTRASSAATAWKASWVPRASR